MEQEPHRPPIRFYEIDLLRFIAAFAVVLFHFTYRGYAADHLSPVSYPELAEFTSYGYLGVNLFFMISGYVILLSAYGKTVKQFFVSRIMRLYPAYWVAGTLVFIVMWVWGPAPNTPGFTPILEASAREYGYNMTMLHHFFGVDDLDGTYWTLTYELVFYFLVSLLVAYDWWKHLLFVLSAWLLYTAVAGPAEYGSPFGLLLFPKHSPFFIAGMVLFLIQQKWAAPWKLYTLLLASYGLALWSGIVGLNETILYYQEHFSDTVVISVITSFFVVMLLIVHRKINLSRFTWLTWLGALTYPLYLLHHNIGYVIYQRLGDKVDKYALLAGLLVLMLVSAYLLHVLVEKPFAKPLGRKVSQVLARL